ncbi:MAG: histidine kinase [Spirochaetales bacterium]|nr:histidine kinase [Spirochaetales bacterium]
MRSNSLRTRLSLFYGLSMGITGVFLGIIMLLSMELRQTADRQFTDEQQLRDLQFRLENLQEPLLGYLSSWSSASLSELLIMSEGLKGQIPEEKPISREPAEQFKREIYFLVEAYLDQIEKIIGEKRARNITAYTNSYEFLQELYTHINNRIDKARLTGFRRGMESFQSFLVLFGRMQMYNLLLMLAGAGVAFSLLLLTVDRITSPMYELSLLAEHLSRNEFDLPDVHLNSVDEVNRVAEAFNDMKHNIHHYIEELKKQREMELRNMKMEQMLKRMELYTMQAQMNPHFLFNTINTGVQLAIMEEADKTVDFMETLANLFRHNLRDKQFFVTLRHEMEGLTSYLSILRIRFSKTRDFNMTCPEEYLDRFTVPAMIVQPLVENSVVHAFRNHEGRAQVSVDIRYEEPYLIFTVKDNGSGIPEKTVRRLLEKHSLDYSMESKVMGLDNVIQRLYFFFPGQNDVVRIHTAADEGTEIIIRINTEVEPCMTL